MVTIKKKRRETETGQLIVKNVARIMERERIKRGLSVKELRDLLELHPPTYYGIQDGTANPTVFVLTRIAEALEVSILELMFGTLLFPDDRGAELEATESTRQD